MTFPVVPKNQPPPTGGLWSWISHDHHKHPSKEAKAASRRFAVLGFLLLLLAFFVKLFWLVGPERSISVLGGLWVLAIMIGVVLFIVAALFSGADFGDC